MDHGSKQSNTVPGTVDRNIIIYIDRMARKTRKRCHRGGSHQWAIIQYDDRKLTDVDKGLINRVAHYAKKWGHEHILKTSGYEDISPYWRKVFLAKDILNTGNYKGVVWLDTDATVYNMDKDLNSLIEEGKHFYKSADNTPGNKRFCAGVWFVLNTDIGKEILSKWTEGYKPDKWKKNGNGKWKGDGEWAGTSFEQGSFMETILPTYENSLKHYDDTFLQALEPRPDAFILHFYFTKDNRAGFLEKHPLPMMISVGGRKTRKRRRRA